MLMTDYDDGNYEAAKLFLRGVDFNHVIGQIRTYGTNYGTNGTRNCLINKQ